MKIDVIGSGSSGNCYVVSDGTTNIMLDAGIPISRFRNKYHGLCSDMDAVLISHEHKDHTKYLKNVIDYGVKGYSTKGTIDALNFSSPLLFGVESLKPFRVGTFEITPFDLVHDSAEPTGFHLISDNGESLVYITDTMYCNYRFKNLNYLLMEVNFDYDTLIQESSDIKLAQRICRTHMSLYSATQFLQANDLSELKELYLIHLSNINCNEDSIKRKVSRLIGSARMVIA